MGSEVKLGSSFAFLKLDFIGNHNEFDAIFKEKCRNISKYSKSQHKVPKALYSHICGTWNIRNTDASAKTTLPSEVQNFGIKNDR